jgi:hypothetical protein
LVKDSTTGSRPVRNVVVRVGRRSTDVTIAGTMTGTVSYAVRVHSGGRTPPLQTGGSAREKRLADVPAKYRGLYRRAWDAASRKSAIRAFCLECVGWQESEVRWCTAPACPLFEFRLRG